MHSPFLSDWVLGHAAATPDAPAVATPTARLSYRDLADRAGALAADLGAAGIEPGDRVLIALPNVPATVVAGLAVHLRGAVAVEVSREWRPESLAQVVARSRPQAAVLWRRDLPSWTAVLPGTGIREAWLVQPGPGPLDATTLPGIGVRALLEDGRLDGSMTQERPPAAAAESARPDPSDPALILFTSGSTGAPHGVVQTFRNIDANSRSIVEYLGLRASDRAMLTLPLSYCYGRSVLQTHLLVGGSVFLDNRMAFPRRVLETAAAEGCTGFAGVPLTFELIRRQVDLTDLDLASLRYVTQAGGAMAAETIAWARTAFAPAELYVMYGQTEATARLAYLPPARALDKAGSVGIAIPGVDLRVVDEAGRELPDGVVGEVIARGDNVTLGYLDEPEETARILRDGWLWTGDLGRRDADGYLFLEGRAREILKIGGRRVSPGEIERALAEEADVVEAAVTGLPDELLGEVPIAFVVVAAGSTIGEADLLRSVRTRLAPSLVPRRILVVDGLPRSDAGKLLRPELLRRFEDRLRG